MDIHDILIRPIVSEKMTQQGEKLNKYAFVVNPKANKLQIKQAVEQFYGVRVVDVNTMNYRGKTRRKYTKSGIIYGRTNHFKKAIVTLAEGDTIDFFSQI
jgi:large subunit ribosomal protein L23